MNLLELLKQDAPEWDAYIHHKFCLLYTSDAADDCCRV